MQAFHIFHLAILVIFIMSAETTFYALAGTFRKNGKGKSSYVPTVTSAVVENDDTGVAADADDFEAMYNALDDYDYAGNVSSTMHDALHKADTSVDATGISLLPSKPRIQRHAIEAISSADDEIWTTNCDLLAGKQKPAATPHLTLAAAREKTDLTDYANAAVSRVADVGKKQTS